MALQKQVIAIDVDDVLAQECEAIRRFVNERYGLNLTEEDYRIEGEYWGYWERVWGVDKEEGRRRYKAYLESDIKGAEDTISGAVEVIAYLEKRYKLVVVTSRPQEIVDVTHKWLARHFPDAFAGVEFVVAWGMDKKTSKGVVCKQIGASYLIDDHVEHCRLAAELGVEALLFGDYGWNKVSSVPTGVARVSDWQAVKEYFDAKG